MKTSVFSPQRVFVFVTLCLLASLTWSCKKDDVSARTNSEILFTLKVKGMFPDQGTTHVIVSGADGSLIDYKQVTPNTDIVFTKPDNYSANELMVTYLYRPKAPFANNYSLTTTQNVAVGSEWTWDIPPATPTLSQANIQVTNVPSNVVMLKSPATSITNYEQSLKSGVSYPIQLYPALKEIWLQLEYNGSQPNTYYLLKDVQANGTYIVDLSQFKPGNNKSIAMKESGFSMDVTTFGMIQQTISQVVFENGIQKSPELQDQILSSVTVTYPTTTVDNFWMYSQWKKKLPQSSIYSIEQLNLFFTEKTIPDVLPTLDANFEIEKSSLQDFRMTTTGTYDSYGIFWNNGITNPTVASPSVNWNIAGKAATVVTLTKLPEIPQELLNTTLAAFKCTGASLGKGTGENESSRTKLLR